MTIVLGVLTAVSSIAASVAASLGYLNHKKVTNVQATVNGRLQEALEMVKKSAEALATSELKRHAGDDQ